MPLPSPFAIIRRQPFQYELLRSPGQFLKTVALSACVDLNEMQLRTGILAGNISENGAC
jgi:hypothetical protein